MSRHTRREFLATTSVAVVNSSIRARRVRAHGIPVSAANAGLPAMAFFHNSITPTTLRTLATQAVDAARAAGASYADVRVAERVRLMIGAPGGAAVVSDFELIPEFMYGVRALVDGAWAFTHGVTPETDALATAARSAVATARGYARLNAGANSSRTGWAPMPTVTGEWAAPFEMDPFAVPLGDQAALISACMDAASRVRNAGVGFSSSITWMRETRVFASTEGSLVTQTFRTFDPGFSVQAGFPYIRGVVSLPSPLTGSSGGYECMMRPALQDEFKRTAEEAARYLSLPRGRIDVGRYPIVFNGIMLGAALSRTLGRAVELDRALGEEVDAGSSYLSPPEEILGRGVASPHLTVTANRVWPSVTAAKWDDDGIEPATVPIIEGGTLVNYLTSRRTLPFVHQSVSATGTGCAVAPDADAPVLVRVPHLAVAPSATRASLEELCQSVSRGILVLQGHLTVDQQVRSGFMFGFGAMFEMAHGKIVRRLVGNGLQFTTRRFWQSLAALGDESTVMTTTFPLDKGQPSRTAWTSTSAPAGLFKDIDVLNTQVWI